GHERLPRFDAAVAVERHIDDVAADLGRLVPRAVARDEDAAAILLWEHRAGIEAHAERSRMRTELGDRRHELAAGVSPPELVVGNVALVAVGVAEVLAHLGDAVELVVGQFFRQPVAAVVGEIELLRYWVEVEADRVTHTERIRLGAGAVGIDAADLGVGRRRLADITGRADIDVELVVGPDRHELPAVRAVVARVAVDDVRLRRLVEVVLDFFEFRPLRAFGDVERAVLEGEAVRSVETGGDDESFAFAAARDHGIDLVAVAVADEHGALVAEPQRA